MKKSTKRKNHLKLAETDTKLEEKILAMVFISGRKHWETYDEFKGQIEKFKGKKTQQQLLLDYNAFGDVEKLYDEERGHYLNSQLLNAWLHILPDYEYDELEGEIIDSNFIDDTITDLFYKYSVTRDMFEKHGYPINLDEETRTIKFAIRDPQVAWGQLSEITHRVKEYKFDKIIIPFEKFKLIDEIFQTTLQQKESNVILEKEYGEQEEEHETQLETESDKEVVNLMTRIFTRATYKRATDIHFEPNGKRFRIRYRIDGILMPETIFDCPLNTGKPLIARLKVLSKVDVGEKRKPQDGSFHQPIKNKKYDFRCSFVPIEDYHEKAVVRLLEPNKNVLPIDKLGMSIDKYKSIRYLIKQQGSILLVTGPTNSGKSTTLASIINHYNDGSQNITTIEDPIEYKINGINQIQINYKQGVTYPLILRAMMRQDPNKIMIGEIRDEETAQASIQLALTGHQIFSTLHAKTAAAAYSRLSNFEIDKSQLTHTLAGVTSQRLIRTNCVRCPEEYIIKPNTYDAEILEYLSFNGENKFYKGKGCKHCNQTGYYGRTLIMEVMPVDDVIRDLIMNNASQMEFEIYAAKKGRETMQQDGIRKVFEGVSTFDEIERLTGPIVPQHE
ncbi:GspE/PulE family protein [Nanoarchaeota archaeon]